ncbi:hypothetical protein HCB27_07610 [Listeria booriae]|uniref:Uncharacterized protein n=1 Tax=Listeria booriae TaxID=1552123 RepID=A0A7X0Z620_9LIST|nr:hypothetical protein [Listeria booriae]MBC2176477.1 hypothetical protein [Listeria booriae]MDT0111084.1 hypothetical protein [Listeria booriae]
MSIEQFELLGFELLTPRFYSINGKENVSVDGYDHHQINQLFKTLNSIPKNDIKVKLGNCTITLDSYNENEKGIFSRGSFKVFRSGKSQGIIDGETIEEVGRKKRTQGLDNVIQFIIHKTTGLLLIERDFEKIINIKLINSFVYRNKKYVKKWVKNYNKLNLTSIAEKTFIEIKLRTFLNVCPLPNVEFIDELDNFLRIKKFKIIIESPVEENSMKNTLVTLSKLVKNEENKPENMGQTHYAVEYIMDERGKGLDSKKAKRFLKNIYSSNMYDNIQVEGQSLDKKQKYLTPDSVTKRFYIESEVDIDGNPVDDTIFYELMEEKATEYGRENFFVEKEKCNKFPIKINYPEG